MSDTFCIGLFTPNGPRRLELPESSDVWTAIDRYDRQHGTNIYDLYNMGTIVTDDRLCGNLPAYDPSDEEYALTGEIIADLIWLHPPASYWVFDDCAVEEIPCGFAVNMPGDDGGIVRQILHSEGRDKLDCRHALDEGFAPTDGWEDGLGNTVCPSNGELRITARTVVCYLREYPLGTPRKRSMARPKASRSRKSGTSTKKSTTRGGKKPAPQSSKNRSKAAAKAPAKKTTRTAPRRR